jgi:hypothetical protein
VNGTLRDLESLNVPFTDFGRLAQLASHSAGTFGGSQPTSEVWPWRHVYVTPL